MNPDLLQNVKTVAEFALLKAKDGMGLPYESPFPSDDYVFTQAQLGPALDRAQETLQPLTPAQKAFFQRTRADLTQTPDRSPQAIIIHDPGRVAHRIDQAVLGQPVRPVSDLRSVLEARRTVSQVLAETRPVSRTDLLARPAPPDETPESMAEHIKARQALSTVSKRPSAHPLDNAIQELRTTTRDTTLPWSRRRAAEMAIKQLNFERLGMGEDAAGQVRSLAGDIRGAFRAMAEDIKLREDLEGRRGGPFIFGDEEETADREGLRLDAATFLLHCLAPKTAEEAIAGIYDNIRTEYGIPPWRILAFNIPKPIPDTIE